ncbi:MAG: hypothetical protein WDN06_10175 [Asticcacaulis sp.]
MGHGLVEVVLVAESDQGLAEIKLQKRRLGHQFDRFFMRRLGQGRAAGFEIDLALQFPQVGIVGLFGDQAVELGQGVVPLALLVGGDDAGIACRIAGVGQR